MAKITVDVISSKEFSFEPRGYNCQEVDNFLDEICDEMERMENEIKDLRQKTTAVIPPVQKTAGAVTTEDAESLREILEMAQQVKSETIRKAREDAEAIRIKAETEAGERLNGLAAEQEELEKEVAALKQTAAEYRRQFEELLRAQQEALEKATGLF